jgi:Arginase family
MKLTVSQIEQIAQGVKVLELRDAAGGLSNGEYTFGNIPSFGSADTHRHRHLLQSSYVFDQSSIDADIAILAVPFDGMASMRPGCRQAPRALRDTSARFGWLGEPTNSTCGPLWTN